MQHKDCQKHPDCRLSELQTKNVPVRETTESTGKKVYPRLSLFTGITLWPSVSRGGHRVATPHDMEGTQTQPTTQIHIHRHSHTFGTCPSYNYALTCANTKKRMRGDQTVWDGGFHELKRECRNVIKTDVGCASERNLGCN